MRQINTIINGTIRLNGSMLFVKHRSVILIFVAPPVLASALRYCWLFAVASAVVILDYPTGDKVDKVQILK